MTKTPKGRATRQAFQEAARRVFARNGYLNARIEDIAEEASKSPGTFYLYFENKEALIESLAADWDAELQESLAALHRSDLPPVAALRGAVREFWHHHQRKLGVIIGVFQAAMVDPAAAAIWQKTRAQGVRTIAQGIRQAQAEGYAPGLDADIAASALSAMIEYFAYVWQAVGGETTGIELTDELAIDTLWNLWSHAVYWTVPSEDLMGEAAGAAVGRDLPEGSA